MNAINTSHDLHLLKIDEKVSDPKPCKMGDAIRSL